MQKVAGLIVVASLSLLVSACGNSSEPTPAGSCAYSKVEAGKLYSLCAGFTGPVAAMGPATCTGLNVTWTAGPCSATDRLGTCSITTGANAGLTVAFYAGAYTVTDAEATCIVMGPSLFQGTSIWTAG
jgi:hypothetical protein